MIVQLVTEKAILFCFFK